MALLGIGASTDLSIVSLPAPERSRVDQEAALRVMRSTIEVNRSLFFQVNRQRFLKEVNMVHYLMPGVENLR